jgi:hypothetical protein
MQSEKIKFISVYDKLSAVNPSKSDCESFVLFLFQSHQSLMLDVTGTHVRQKLICNHGRNSAIQSLLEGHLIIKLKSGLGISTMGMEFNLSNEWLSYCNFM